ncbi:MAG: DNA circularization N-terminal domain-containing protein [Candidatus Omnitrophica bacterium]|nr:DNA circularization N-terminal domain-containing protein [Candidatus Omnitrophota bacterium]
MSWRDNLLPASYRNVPFYMESSNQTFGRRVEIKTYAASDEADVLDFGRAPDTFSIEAYVIANAENNFDHFAGRNALMEAINTTILHGTLVHPYYGIMEVAVGPDLPSVTEDSKEGGVSRFSITFTRVTTAQQKKKVTLIGKEVSGGNSIKNIPRDTSSGIKLVEDKIAVANADAQDSFSERFNSSRPYIDKAGDYIKDTIKYIQRNLYRLKDAVSSMITETNETIYSILISIDSVIDTPCTLFTSIQESCNGFLTACGIGKNGTFGGVAGVCSQVVRGAVEEFNGENVPDVLGRSAVDACLDVVDIIDVASTEFIPNSQINNFLAIKDTYKYSLLSAAINICMRTKFISKESLLEYAKKIADYIDDFILALGAETDLSEFEYIAGEFIDNTLLITALMDLKGYFVQVSNSIAYATASVETFTNTFEITNTLLLSYDKYEDLEREDEILAINSNVSHPGFILGGATIKVLNE